MIRIGLDFDNTIICYDEVFCAVAKTWQYVAPDFNGSKQALRHEIQNHHPDGDIAWQRLQGKVYGEFIDQAIPFEGLHDFVKEAKTQQAELYIVSHKTEHGHFDEKHIDLREAARKWLHDKGLLNSIAPDHVFFAPTREEKIEKIRALACTYFIDDLADVLYSPLFPDDVTRILFQPPHTNWTQIKHAIFPG